METASSGSPSSRKSKSRRTSGIASDSGPLAAVYFPSAAAFRAWLQAHHATATECLVGFHKVGSKQPTLTWPESVDAALCHGWIDGIRRRVDATRYTIRFTPRKPKSTWSAVNVRRFAALDTAGLVHPAGRAAFARRLPARTGTYSYENRPADLPPDLVAIFKRNRSAWTFFAAQPLGYQRTLAWYVVSARQSATRLRRLDRLIAASASGQRLR